MHNKNLLINNGLISINSLKNMVTMGCRVEEFDWTEQLIVHYRSFIREAVRNSVYHFNLGAVAFYKKDYEVAHDKFIQVDKINTTYDINTRVLILKCLYEKEKNYSEPTMQAFRSANKYFKDNKSLPAKTRTGYTNFIKILIKIYRLRHNVNTTKADVERIKEKLDTQKVNSDKRWLLEKMEDQISFE